MAAGPTFSGTAQVLDAFHAAERGEATKGQLFNLAMQNTPYINLFYSKMALDYLILNDVREWLNPGYMRRMERQIRKDNGQHVLVRPQR